MKKTKIFIVIIIICIGIVFIWLNVRNQKPFEKLTKEEIKEVTIELYPPGATAELDKEEIEELVEILHQVVIYKKDNTYSDYCGQAVIYKITKNDDTTIEVQAYNPFLIIDGIGYTTKYEPCQKLNSLGNKINGVNY